MKTILRILAGLLALGIFLPVMLIGIAHDILHLVVSGFLYIFANLCRFAANQPAVTFSQILYDMQIKE